MCFIAVSCTSCKDDLLPSIENGITDCAAKIKTTEKKINTLQTELDILEKVKLPDAEAKKNQADNPGVLETASHMFDNELEQAQQKANGDLNRARLEHAQKTAALRTLDKELEDEKKLKLDLEKQKEEEKKKSWF